MALYDEYRHHPLIRVAFGPHSAYSLERKHLNQIAMYADELEAAVQIHLHETQREVAQAHEQLGHGHVELLRDTGLLGPRLQTVHMTQLTAAEIDMVAAAKASVVHCPTSNMQLASGTCPVAELQAQEIIVALAPTVPHQIIPRTFSPKCVWPVCWQNIAMPTPPKAKLRICCKWQP